MKSRFFFLISLLLILAAISFHLCAFGVASKRVDYQHRENTALESERQQLEIERRQLVKKLDAFVISGWAVASVGLLSLFISYRMEENAPRSIVVILLAFYLLLQFGTV